MSQVQSTSFALTLLLLGVCGQTHMHDMSSTHMHDMSSTHMHDMTGSTHMHDMSSTHMHDMTGSTHDMSGSTAPMHNHHGATTHNHNHGASTGEPHVHSNDDMFGTAEEANMRAAELGCSSHQMGDMFMPCSDMEAYTMASGSTMNHTGHDDHDTHSDHNAHAGHSTVFQSKQTIAVLLFEGWEVTNNGQYAGALIAVFLLMVVFQALKHYIRRTVVAALAGKGNSEVPKFSVAHIADSFLYGVQVLIGYFLMLVAMTFNTGLFIALILGAVVGFALFSTPSATLLQDPDCCA